MSRRSMRRAPSPKPRRSSSSRGTASRCSTSARPATPTAAVAAADAIGYPVVVKLCGDAIAHKTERGLVRLGLRDADAVRDGRDRAARRGAARRRRGRAARRADGRAAPASSSPALVRDPQFGPCVMLGVGGVLAEALGDVAFRLVPLTDARRRRADRRPRDPEAARRRSAASPPSTAPRSRAALARPVAARGRARPTSRRST